MPEKLFFLGETYGFWVQTGAIVISAFGAIWAIYHNGKMSKRRATVDVIIQENQDAVLRDAKTTIFRVLKETSLIELYKNETNRGNKHRDMLLVILNRYEFIAQGIRSGAFEEKIYKRMQYSSIMKMWKMSKPLIEEIRRIEERDTLYQEFQWLATRWGKAPLKKCNKS